MYDSDEEYYDPLCFEDAMESLSQVETLEKIQAAAKSIANSDISIFYTTNDRIKHHIHFLINPGLGIEKTCSLMSALSAILRYDQVMIESSIHRMHRGVTPVSGNNIQNILTFLKQYRGFLNEIIVEKAQASNAQALAVQGLMPALAPREPSEKRHKSDSSSGEVNEKQQNSSSPETISPSKKNAGFSSK